MDENFLGNVIVAGVGLAVADRFISGSRGRKRKRHKLKRVTEL